MPSNSKASSKAPNGATAQGRVMHKDQKNEATDKENTRSVKPALSIQQSEDPANATGNATSVVDHHPSSNPPGVDQLAESQPAATRRPLSEMTDFEKSEARKNAHFERRLENARKELEMRDRELEKLDSFVRSLVMRRTAKRGTVRKADHKREKAHGAEPASTDKDATVIAPVGSPQKKATPPHDPSETSGKDNRKKDILNLRSSSGNKVAKSRSSGRTAMNHRK